jgi:hypothetical protein
MDIINFDRIDGRESPNQQPRVPAAGPYRHQCLNRLLKFYSCGAIARQNRALVLIYTP